MKIAALGPIILLGLFFTLTSSVFAINPPELKSPEPGSVTNDTSPTLSWSETCSTNDCYQIQVDNQSDFSEPEKDYKTTNISYSPHLSEGVWYWRVRAKNTEWGPWSYVWNITINLSAPPPPSTPNQQQTQNVDVMLSEFMPNPEEGQEWVEIYNRGSSTANLAGWKIDDAPEKSAPSTFGENFLIEGRGFAVFHFNSKLNNDGDTLRLLRPDGSEVEIVNFGATTRNVSFAKDGKGGWQQTITPTPGKPNKITSGEVLANTNNQESNDEEENSEGDSLKSLPTTSSSSSHSSEATQSSTPKNSKSTFLPAIFVGSGIFLIVAGIVAYLIKTGVIKLPHFKKGQAPGVEKPPSA